MVKWHTTLVTIRCTCVCYVWEYRDCPRPASHNDRSLTKLDLRPEGFWSTSRIHGQSLPDDDMFDIPLETCSMPMSKTGILTPRCCGQSGGIHHSHFYLARTSFFNGTIRDVNHTHEIEHQIHPFSQDALQFFSSSLPPMPLLQHQKPRHPHLFSWMLSQPL